MVSELQTFGKEINFIILLIKYYIYSQTRSPALPYEIYYIIVSAKKTMNIKKKG